jgi:N-acetyl-alpha-D-glucosaminyl L-malate synthase BshA
MFPKYKGDYYGSFVFDEAKILVKKGFEVHVVTQHNPNIPYEEVMDGIHVHRFKWLEPKEFKALVHFKGIKDNFRLITYLISLFFNLIIITRKYDINVIHAHSTIPTGLIGVIVAKIMKKPVFITAHGMDINNFKNSSFFKRLITFSLNNCNKAVAVSSDLAGKIISLGIDKDKIMVLRNAVDTDRFKPLMNETLRNNYRIKDNDVLILFVGYLDTFKGVFELLNAFHDVNNKNKNTKLMIIGEGPKEDELKKKAFKLGLNKLVVFTGKISPADIHEYYQSADIFVLPSHTDAGGPPLVVLEAMACKLPVIGTAIGGIPEGIENDVNGFIVPPKNIDELTEKLETLVKDENLRKTFGINSLKKVRENSMTLGKKAEKLINLYKNQIKNHAI